MVFGNILKGGDEFDSRVTGSENPKENHLPVIISSSAI